MSKTSPRSPRTSNATKTETPSINITQELSDLPLKKFSKKLYEVEFAYPFSFSDKLLLQEIVDAGKKYEYLSDVYFITYEDVLGLIERLAQPDAEVNLPTRIKEYAQRFVTTELETMTSISLKFLAIMTKLTIIESMYKSYRNEVNNMERRKQVHDGLGELLHDCEPREKGQKGKKDKSSKKSKNDKSKSKKSKAGSKNEKKSKVSDKETKVIIDDYTEIILEENETIFDYNVDNHLQYFVLTEFPDFLLLPELISLSVYVSAIIDVSYECSDYSQPDDSTMTLKRLFDTPKDTGYLENTAWMKYRNDGTTTPKETLEEFLYVVKRINFIKRQHLSYIRKLNLSDLGPTPNDVDFECLEKYNRILNSFPPELINIPVIINALVEEICWREAGKIYSLSDLTPSSESEDFSTHKPVESFQTHEEDYLKMGMRAYHEIGRKYYDQSLEYLKLLQPLAKVDHCERVSFRTVAVSTDETCFCDTTKDLFDYFHLAIFNQMKRREFKPKQPQNYYLTHNLVTHDQEKEYKRAVPKVDVICKSEENNLVNNYHMKEDLSSTVLFQLIFKAANDYSSWDRDYCNISKSVLLRFHDNINDFGIDTKLWDQNLRTPVCLRDFCRFVVNEDRQKQWLVEHKLTDHADLNEDKEEIVCEGLVDMHIPELYEEYQYLLGATSETGSEQKKQIFDDVLAELSDYPKSEILTSYCSDDAPFIAYDLGPQLCQLTGFTTIFHSDDGVKLTIDTTRFMMEEPKCSITVAAGDNTLVFHKTRPSAFHCLLEDETIVSFSEFDESEDISWYLPPREELSNYGACEGEENEYVYEQLEEESRVPNYNDYWIQVLRKSNISTTIPNFFNKPTISDRKVKLDDKNLYRLLELFKAAVYLQRPIYKISTKPSLRRLKRTDSPLHIPFVTCLKRFLFKPLRKKRRIGGHSVFNIPQITKKLPLKYDFKITLPNGILLSTLPRNKPFAEIKQQHKYKHYKELYRIFYSNGVVVVKNFDGTTTILRSNGDIINLTEESECYSANCANNMTQIFRREEEENCPYLLSRCHASPKPKIVKTTFVDLYEFGDIPYAKKTLLQFEGKKIYVSADTIHEKQLYYVLSEQDYHTEEVFTEREDGMKCISNKKGVTTFQFPDGTKITSYPEFEKELIFVGKKYDSEGWVSVIVSYKFEHPDYLAVEYCLADRSTTIFLKDAVVKNYQDSYLLSTKNNVGLEVSSNQIIFLKSCESCDSDCICKIHINDENSLLEVYDSYEKYLVCDRSGHCKTNSGFVKTPGNKKGCKHRWMTEKEKFLIINERGPPGILLWKDSLVEKKINRLMGMKHVKVANYMNKLTKKHTVEFFTKIYRAFVDRFTCKPRDIYLKKYKDSVVPEPQICYVTYRILCGFHNLLHDPEIVASMTKFLEMNDGGEKFKVLFEGIKQLVTYVSDFQSNTCDKLSFQLSMETRADNSNSSETSFEVPKSSVDEIINKWKTNRETYWKLIRNKIFSPYFHSEYYRQVLESLEAPH